MVRTDPPPARVRAARCGPPSLALAGWLALTLLGSAAPSAPPLILDAAEFGLSALAPGADATPTLRRALEACRAEGAGGLRLPPGEWHLFPGHAFEQTLAVANNDPGGKRVVFEDNVVETFHRAVAGVQAVDGLVFRNNTLRMTRFRAECTPPLASFRFASGRGIAIEGNRFEGAGAPTVKAGTPGAVPRMKGNQGIVFGP